VPEVTATKTLILTRVGGQIINLSAALGTQTCEVETKTLDAGVVNFSKFLDQLFFQLTNRDFQTNMVVEIWTADEDADENFVLSQTVNVSDGNPTNLRVPDSRFFRIKFRDLGILERWRLSKFDVMGELISEEY